MGIEENEVWKWGEYREKQILIIFAPPVRYKNITLEVFSFIMYTLVYMYDIHKIMKSIRMMIYRLLSGKFLDLCFRNTNESLFLYLKPSNNFL